MLAILIGLPACAADEPRSEGSDNILQIFAVPKDGHPLLLPVAFKGKTYKFILDTGSTFTVFDSSLPLGEPKGRAQVGAGEGQIVCDLFPPPQASVGKVPLQADLFVMGYDLRRLREFGGPEIRGVLGLDFLRRHVVQIDVAGGTVTFLKRVDFEPGRKLRLVENGHHVYVEGTAAGLQGRERYQIDTGDLRHQSGAMRKELLANLLKRGDAHAAGKATSSSLSGTEHETLYEVKGFTVGALPHPPLVFREASESSLSLRYWARYVVTFDFPGGSIYLRPGPRFECTDRVTRSGLRLARIGGSTVVESVAPGSPAAASGIRAGDVIVEIGGQLAARARLYELESILGSDQKHIALRIMRGEREIELVIGPTQTGAAGPR